jgi:hypothetical protein
MLSAMRLPLHLAPHHTLLYATDIARICCFANLHAGLRFTPSIWVIPMFAHRRPVLWAYLRGGFDPADEKPHASQTRLAGDLILWRQVSGVFNLTCVVVLTYINDLHDTFMVIQWCFDTGHQSICMAYSSIVRSITRSSLPLAWMPLS